MRMSKRALGILLVTIALALGITSGLTQHAQQAPSVAPSAACEAPTTGHMTFNPCATLDPTQVQDHRPTAYDCDAVAAHVYATQNYSGTDSELACLGEEDDARVGLALDYGQTEAGYAASEAAQVAAPAPALPAGLVPCTEEDGSVPGQAFPCRWDATAHGNGKGQSFTLWDATSEPDYS